MRKNNAKTLLYIAILSSAVVLTWIGTTIFYSLSTSTTPVDTSKYSTPIAPSFDIPILESLSSRATVPVDFSEKGIYNTDTNASNSSELNQSQPSQEEVPSFQASPTTPPVFIEQAGSPSGTTVDIQPGDQTIPPNQ